MSFPIRMLPSVQVWLRSGSLEVAMLQPNQICWPRPHARHTRIYLGHLPVHITRVACDAPTSKSISTTEVREKGAKTRLIGDFGSVCTKTRLGRFRPAALATVTRAVHQAVRAHANLLRAGHLRRWDSRSRMIGVTFRELGIQALLHEARL